MSQHISKAWTHYRSTQSSEMCPRSGVFPSDLLPSHPLPGLDKYTVIVNTDVHIEPVATGLPWTSIRDPRTVTTSTHTGSSSSSVPYDTFSSGTVLCGASTPAPCKVSPHKYADSTPVYSRSAWTEAWALTSLSTCSARWSRICRWRRISYGSLDVDNMGDGTVAAEAGSAVPVGPGCQPILGIEKG